MKTAMQELQDALEIYSRHNKGTQEGKAIDITLSAFPKFIEAEKEQILEAYKAGHVDGYELGKHYEDEIYPNSSYYTQTFKSDE